MTRISTAHAHYRRRYRDLRQFLTQAYQTLADRGQLSSAIDPPTLATMTIALVNGLQAQWLFDREGVDLASTLRQYLASLIPDFDTTT